MAEARAWGAMVSTFKRRWFVCGPQTLEVLTDAIGRTLDAAGAKDAKGFFTHRGYRGVE